MKNIYHLITAFVIINCQLSIINLQAQVPQGMNYQAVARNAAGNPLVNSSVAIRVSIHDGTASGTVVYSERDTATTNSFGLFSCKIGAGNVISGTFAGINWASGDKYMQVELDPTGGSSYTNMGTTQLLSVPYALHAQTSGDNKWTKTGNDISNTNTGNVGIGTASPNASAALDITSTTGAFLQPRMNTTQRNALAASEGMTIYNTDLHTFQGYAGTRTTLLKIDTAGSSIPRSIVGGFWTMYQSILPPMFSTWTIGAVTILTDNASSSATGTFSILSGNGTGGSTLYSQAFSFTNCGGGSCETTIYLTTPFVPSGGMLYTLKFEGGNNTSMSTFTNGSNPYNGGQVYQNSNSQLAEDMYLRIYATGIGWVDLH